MAQNKIIVVALFLAAFLVVARSAWVPEGASNADDIRGACIEECTKENKAPTDKKRCEDLCNKLTARLSEKSKGA
jgi:hypothetical protein